jgi:outer membrane protein TolC
VRHHQWLKRKKKQKMKKSNRKVYLLIASMIFIFNHAAYAQIEDTISIFTIDQFTWFLEKYHPVAKQAGLLERKGRSTVRRARGAFDPGLGLDFDQKDFNGIDYFTIVGSGLKIPTWLGVDIKSGFDYNRGVYINPENNLPASGLWYAGVSVPLGQGLFIDNRRAALKQAKIYAQSTEAEQQQIMNNLYFDAIKQYWKWVASKHQLELYENSLELANFLFGAVKQAYIFGDRPAIDTLEAYILLQNREFNRNQYQLLYKNETLELSNYLWFENDLPLEITESLRPPSLDEISMFEIWTLDSLETIVAQLEKDHPFIRMIDYNLQSIQVDRRLKIENLKPQIDINYNILNEAVGNNIVSGLSPNNYKWGVDFSFPLFLRAQRGDLQLTNIRIQETELFKQQKLLEQENKVRQYHNEQITLKDQIELYSDAVNNYEGLFRGERQKFDMGESSLFLLNTRENSLIDANLKLIDIKTKYLISYTGLQWAAGSLY